MENKDKFKIVSRVYRNNFETVTFVIFNSETGELSKEVINNNINEVTEEESSEHEREIRTDTAKNIQHEINELSNGYPIGEAQHAWNNAIATAAECCNGYEQED